MHQFGLSLLSNQVWQALTPVPPDFNIAGYPAVARKVPAAKITHHPRPLVNKAAALRINIKMGGQGGDWRRVLANVIVRHARWCVILATTRCDDDDYEHDCDGYDDDDDDERDDDSDVDDEYV